MCDTGYLYDFLHVSSCKILYHPIWHYNWFSSSMMLRFKHFFLSFHKKKQWTVFTRLHEYCFHFYLWKDRNTRTSSTNLSRFYKISISFLNNWMCKNEHGHRILYFWKKSVFCLFLCLHVDKHKIESHGPSISALWVTDRQLMTWHTGKSLVYVRFRMRSTTHTSEKTKVTIF